MTEVPIGRIRTEDHVVAEEDVITFLGAGNSRVLSTPRMILFMERTCRNMMAEVLDPGFSTVGMHVNIWHLAAAKEGATVTYKAELLKCTSRRCEFRVEARSGDKLIGEGTHLRGIIDMSRFAKS
ncbi:MAG TPA: hotdog domain-containing protein [Bryobacteraceae bacterium]|nr:hotdog domain-containing protein [Bryobacteraceae bacterium]